VHKRDGRGTEPPDPLLARLAQHVAPGAGEPTRSGKKRRTRPVPRWRWDDTTSCVLCDEDNDPAHPNSPYCVRDRKIVTSETQARSRQRAKDAKALLTNPAAPREHTFTDTGYTGPLGVAVQGTTADQVRTLYGALLSAVDLARENTDGFKTSTTAETEWVLKHLRATVRAVRNLNELLGPLLYGSTLEDE